MQAESENVQGDGKRTSTLQQKGTNYEEVEEEKELARQEAMKKERTLMVTTYTSTAVFLGYRDKIKKITFEDSINIPSDISDEYKWDVSEAQEGKVRAYITLNASDPTYYDLYIQGDGELYANSDSSCLFDKVCKRR